MGASRSSRGRGGVADTPALGDHEQIGHLPALKPHIGIGRLLRLQREIPDAEPLHEVERGHLRPVGLEGVLCTEVGDQPRPLTPNGSAVHRHGRRAERESKGSTTEPASGATASWAVYALPKMPAFGLRETFLLHEMSLPGTYPGNLKFR